MNNLRSAFQHTRTRRCLAAALLFSLPLGLGTPAAQAQADAAQPPTLSVPWSRDLDALWAHVYNARTDTRLPRTLTGDGTTDDLPAIQADLAWLNQHAPDHKGVLYLPAGTYFLDNNGNKGAVTLVGSAAVAGDGPGQTVLTFPSLHSQIGFNAPTTAGLYNLSIASTAPDEQAPYTQAADFRAGLNYNFTTTPSSEVFLKNVSWDIGSSEQIALSSIHGLDVEDCTVNATRGNHGFMAASNCQDVVIVRNKFHYKSGRMGFIGSTNVTLKDNQFTRDGGIHTPRIESGAVDLSYTRSCFVDHNQFTTLGTLDLGNNDGETILTQNDGGTTRGVFSDVGTLTAATTTTLTDAGKNWPAAWRGQPEVCFTSGVNLGQSRLVASHTANALTFTTPLKHAPAPGDTYCLLTWSAKDLTIVHNVLTNNPRGIVIYGGGQNVVVSDNTLVDSGSVTLYAWDRGEIYHMPAWNNVITNNVVKNPGGLRHSTVAILVLQTNAVAHGNLVHGNLIRANTIGRVPAGANPAQDQEGVVADGIYIKDVRHSHVTGLISNKAPTKSKIK